MTTDITRFEPDVAIKKAKEIDTIKIARENAQRLNIAYNEHAYLEDLKAKIVKVLEHYKDPKGKSRNDLVTDPSEDGRPATAPRLPIVSGKITGKDTDKKTKKKK